MKRKTKNAFTLVELLAVIVILAIILVIAVPKVMSVIEDSKKATLESTAKMIASGAEKQKVQNTVLGKEDEITCESVAKINKGDYASCDITFDNNTAKVTIEGSGKFDGLYVCNGTKTSATAVDQECSPEIQSLQVTNQLFFPNEELTPEKFDVRATFDDGSVEKLSSGELKLVEEETRIITSPNWPNPYPELTPGTEGQINWELEFEGAESLQITFDETSYTKTAFHYAVGEVCVDGISIYNKVGKNIINGLCGHEVAGKTYEFEGDYIKITMYGQSGTGISDISSNNKGFSAVVTPIREAEADYTISPSVAPSTTGNFDITITTKDGRASKKISTTIGAHNAADYVESHKVFDAVQTTATVNGETIDAGIRYVGELPNNKIYFNCKDTDSNGVAYGSDTYDYANSCEVWRIIGVFNTKSSETDTTGTPRVKIVRDVFSTSMAWDVGSEDDNWQRGVNQWGESTKLTYRSDTGYTEIEYNGADLMQLLNGYYIGEEDTCTYYYMQSGGVIRNDCTSSVSPLSTTSLEMIDDVLWYTGAPIYNQTISLSEVYSAERSTQTGKICTSGTYCSDKVTRTTTWVGKIGLIYPSDYAYASMDEGCTNDIFGSDSKCHENNWLHPISGVYHTITPLAYPSDAYSVMTVSSSYRVKSSDSGSANGVRPALYLSENVKITGGNGDTEPYKLSVQ